MATETTSLHEVFFAAEGIEPGVATVRRFDVREGLSVPTRAEIEIDLPAPMDPRAWLLKPAQLVTVQASDGTVLRRLSGVVTTVRARAGRRTPQRVVVVMESLLAILRLTKDHRIFQQSTTQTIVSALLMEAGIEATRVAWRLQGSYPEREVCTQFGETSFDFMSRILEEDGIFYFTEYGEDGPIVVFADSSAAYARVTPDDEIRHATDSGLISTEAVASIAEVERVRPGKVTLRDHDFKRPALDLTASATSSAVLAVERYEFPGRYTDPGEGERRAQLRLDALSAEAVGATAEGPVFSFAPGYTFKLVGAPDGALDREWVVVGFDLRWDDVRGGTSSLRSRFRLLPRDVPFRPPARTPRAVVPGPQLGVITGPPGEEIYTDELGRVKVHFFWDRRSQRDDKSSAWIRVGQMHTSGSVAIPRVGWEVLVDFEDGDPDRPIVMGRLYNGKDGPPYTLPASKTMSALMSHSSPGGSGHNEIRAEDGAGGEHLSVRAQKDWNLNVANNKTEKVATNESVAVGADEEVQIGGNETVQVGADLSLTVGSSQSWSVGGSRSVTVGAAESISVKGSRSLSIGGSHTTMTPMVASTTTSSSLSETVGGSCIEAAALSMGIAVAGAASVTVGGAKIAAVATGATDVTVGAKASTVGGAFISAAGGDVGIGVGGAKATTVGGAWAANAGGDIELTSGKTLNITVGGAVAMNAAEITLKVGGSSVTMSAGQVALKAAEIKLTATGPQAELAPMVEDK